MKQIDSFSITLLTVSGFKCFNETTSFNLGDMTLISGSNGVGKSSIADAIAFAFVGTPFFGEKRLSRLQNKEAQEMSVTVEFIDDNNTKHTLVRSRRQESTSITFDGFAVRQTDLNTLFGDKDLFLSILNPLYFINVLGDKGKNLLEKMLPTVSHEDVLNTLSKELRELLADCKLGSPDFFIKKCRSDLKESEELLITYKSQKELQERQLEDRTIKIETLQKTLKSITYKMTELSSIRKNTRNISQIESKLEDLKKQRNELVMLSSADRFNLERQPLLNKIREIENSIQQRQSAEYVSPYLNDIAKINAELNSMYTEHANLQKALKVTVPGYKCSTCAAIITTSNVNSVRKDLEARITSIITKGKKVKDNLLDIQEKDNNNRKNFDTDLDIFEVEESAKIANLKQELLELHISNELDAESYNNQLLVIEEQIEDQEYYLRNGSWTPEQVLLFSSLEKSKSECQAKIEALNSYQSNDYTTLISELEDNIIKQKKLINGTMNYIARRIELMVDGLKMNKVKIVLNEVVKSTGELRDCFHFSYDGRDYRCLSLSEKIIAGFEICLLIQRLSKRKYPVFVDNTESLSSYNEIKPTGQIIYARVAKSSTLQLSIKNHEELKAS